MTTATEELRPESTAYQLFMLVLSLYSLGSLAVQTMGRLPPASRQILDYADVAACVCFFADFVVCLRRAPNRWRYLRTWGWLDLISCVPTVDAARWGRAGRLFRIIRVLRGLKAGKLLASLVMRSRYQSAALAALLVSLLLLVVSCLAIVEFENRPDSNIRTADDAIWWAFTTITTVGYGDRYPVTAEGRFVAGVLMCAGVGLFGTFSASLANWFLSAREDEAENAQLEALRVEVQTLRTLVSLMLPPEALARARVEGLIPEETSGSAAEDTAEDADLSNRALMSAAGEETPQA